MTEPLVSLRALERSDLPLIEPWFRDPDTQRYLGGPDWPRTMLDRRTCSVGETFRGAVQISANLYLAHAGARPVGYVDCCTFDRCAVYAGEGPHGLTITETVDAITGTIAFVIDPPLRRRGLGRAMIAALLDRPELRAAQLFEAGVEPGNVASRRCLEAAGFRLRDERPDFEGMLYYYAWRVDLEDTLDARRASSSRRQSPRE